MGTSSTAPSPRTSPSICLPCTPKTIAELKGGFALDVISTRHYGANCAWQQLSVLAHDLICSFQVDTLATPKPRSRKRTYMYRIRSMRTLRFLLVTRPAT